MLKDLGLPEDMLTFINFPTRYDCREALAALKGSGIACPRLDDYAWKLWDYWERHLNPSLKIDHSLRGTVGGKVVLVTGGSSGIGLAAACKFAEAGAITVICARDEAQRAEARREIVAKAGKGAIVETFSADIADEASCKASSTGSPRAMAASTSWTTPAARSGAPSRRATTASTTSSGPCS